jgi:nucleotide-binding universal stress UspA family protein
VVQKILYRAKTSVMIVRAYEAAAMSNEPLAYERILAPLDGSKRAECVLPFFDALDADGAPEVTLVSVVVRPEMPRRAPPTPEDAALADRVVERNREEAERYLEGVGARLNCATQIQLRVGEDLIADLHDLADNSNFDLVVLSAHGYSGDNARPFGSVVTSFIAHSSKPLLIVQDLSQDDLEETRAEEMAEQVGKSDSGKGGRTILHAS